MWSWLLHVVWWIPPRLGKGGGGHEGQFSRDPLPFFSAKGHYEQFCHWHGYSLFDVVPPAFPLLTTVLSTLQGALKDGFGKAVMAFDTHEPCKFLSLDSCQKRFLSWLGVTNQRTQSHFCALVTFNHDAYPRLDETQGKEVIFVSKLSLSVSWISPSDHAHLAAAVCHPATIHQINRWRETI